MLKELIYDNTDEIKIEMVGQLLKSNGIKHTYRTRNSVIPRKASILVNEKDYQKAKELLESNKIVKELSPQNRMNKKQRYLLLIAILIIFIIFFIMNYLL